MKIKTERSSVKKYPGEIWIWGGTIATIPSGNLLCDGSAVSRATYARLFSAIGTSKGSGNGATTFNLPNLVNRFPAGATADSGGQAVTNISGAGNALEGGVASHGHGVSDPGHSHTASDSGHNHCVDLQHNHSYSGCTVGHCHCACGTIGTNDCPVQVDSGVFNNVTVSADCHRHAYSGSTDTACDNYSGTTSDALCNGQCTSTGTASVTVQSITTGISVSDQATVNPYQAVVYVIAI